jgi:hypothetical protein
MPAAKSTDVDRLGAPHHRHHDQAAPILDPQWFAKFLPIVAESSWGVPRWSHVVVLDSELLTEEFTLEPWG